jgi:alcohol dehydrogenase class IV
LPDYDMIIAVGGGSVLDAAKGLSALRALDGDAGRLRANVVDGEALPDSLNCVPIIAVPTTSGTGSEVTRWGTLWGKAKYSIAHPALYPKAAVLDPRLCVSMPEEVTLCSGLDALSHAMEAVWNRHNTPASDFAAVMAIRTLKNTLKAVMENPTSLELRQQIQVGALYAGYAMGTTQTALSHSISYPFTVEFGLPHGFACSFTLGEVARYNIVEDEARMSLIADAFGCPLGALGDAISVWIKSLGVSEFLKKYIGVDAAERFSDDLINPARAANNLRSVDGATARGLVQSSLQALL